ncbi:MULTISPECIES: hypothetical protein [unclassified Methylobacterium]|uniref:hypothetical protein n=1 Tax=unclassified Methylobacterium TaxID=2615210 RepID=UPI0011147954|nr:MULTISPECIES: hypothetical protein [unclassified Methylobacterium]
MSIWGSIGSVSGDGQMIPFWYVQSIPVRHILRAADPEAPLTSSANVADIHIRPQAQTGAVFSVRLSFLSRVTLWLWSCRGVAMGQSVQFAVQRFQDAGPGQWSRGRLTECRTADEARRLAERCVARGESTGAAAFSRRSSGEFGVQDSPITIAAFGDVPPEAKDILPF